MRWIFASMLLVLARPAVAGEVEPWKPAQVSSPQFESHAAFDQRTGDFFFVRSAPNFTGWRILVSRCGDQGWSAPEPPGFAGPGLEADPFITADGSTLYFISTRASGALDSGALDIWRVSRAPGGGWGSPERLPEPVNSAAAEWYPRLAPDGWLYFGSSRPGGVGGTDIWRARSDDDGRWTAENLGPNVNGAGEDYEPLLSPDGATMLLMTDGGYYETRRTAQGWSPRVKLGPEINKNGTEIGALFSPSGNSILFARATKEGGSGEFFLWRRGPAEAWPPECPGGAGR